LRWAHHTQAGVSNLHRSDLWTSDVTLTSTRGSVSARAIAEYAVAAAMFAARGLDEAARQKADGRFTRSGYRMRTVQGSTMGIVGLGGIGREVGRMARALGMRVVATRWSIDSPEENADGADLVLPADRLLEVAAQSDVLVVCSQLTEETRHLIDRSVFAAMPAHAVLVNVARGEEVDEEALLDALESRRLGSAALDVFEGEPALNPRFLKLENVLLQPHHASGTVETRKAMGQLMRDNLTAHFADRPLPTPVL
jgi:phosphoglycerate dehydrogenase-like enzyme